MSGEDTSYLDQLVETLQNDNRDRFVGSEDRAFSGKFIPSDSPLVPPAISASLDDKLDFIVARAMYFYPRLMIMNVGGEDVVYDGVSVFRMSEYNRILYLAKMVLPREYQILSFNRLLTLLPRGTNSTIEISPTLYWDKERGELRKREIKEERKDEE